MSTSNTVWAVTFSGAWPVAMSSPKMARKPLRRGRSAGARDCPLLIGAEDAIPNAGSSRNLVTYHLCSHVQEIVSDRIRVEVHAADEVLDISRRKAVIGIRNQRPEAVDLVARSVRLACRL